MRDTIVIPAHGNAGLTRLCVETLLAQELDDAEIVVVDDASPDDTVELLAPFRDSVAVIERRVAGGFAAACNEGAAHASGGHVVFLNNDTVPQPGWLDALRAYGDSHPEAGLVGARLLYPDGSVQHAGVCFRATDDGSLGAMNLYRGLPGEHPAVLRSRPLQAVTAACVRADRALFEELGGFDTAFHNGFEDVDLCLRVRDAGREVHYCADAVVVHLEEATRGRDTTGFNEALADARWSAHAHRDELELYVRDGLIRIADPAPLPEIEISPLIGVAARSADGRGADDRIERLLLEASRRVHELEVENAELRRSGLRPRSADRAFTSSGGIRPLPRATRELVPPGGVLNMVAHLDRITRPLALRVDPDAEPAVNLLVPELRPVHMFAGYAAKLELAGRLRRRGRRVRIVATDDPVDRARLAEHLAAQGQPELLEGVELADRPDPAAPLAISPADTFVATTWWTAHVAHAAARQLGAGEFVALIQEHESLTFPNGSFAAAAEQALALPHRAVFSTDLLRDHFRSHRLGVFANGDGDGRSAVLRNPLVPVSPPVTLVPGDRGLLLYARPANTEARNMFELAYAALREAVERGVFSRNGASWRFTAVGVPDESRELPLGDGHVLAAIPRLSPPRYAALLRRHDVGLALLHTPHPGLVPFEMAASGMLAVTNTYGVKTAERLRELSPNVVPAEPTVEGLVAGLADAVARSYDRAARMRGAEATVAPRTADEAFDESTMRAIERLLDGCRPAAPTSG